MNGRARYRFRNHTYPASAPSLHSEKKSKIEKHTRSTMFTSKRTEYNNQSIKRSISKTLEQIYEVKDEAHLSSKIQETYRS